MIIILLMPALVSSGQLLTDSAGVYHSPASGSLPHQGSGRKWLIGSASVAAYGTSIILFSKAWYKNYPRSSFHTYNDGGEWLQMDKTGHAWGAYNAGRLATGMWQWAGVKHSTSVLLGAGSSVLYLLSIEYLDGRSAEWGWSWPDVTADISGAALFAAQELGWKEQRIQLKFSSLYHNYHPASLEKRADDLFGHSVPERVLKDYNQQTYWLSFNLHSFFPRSGIPPWLNLGFGYGASGMFGGYSNLAYDGNGSVTFNRSDIPRRRQWYLSPDIDLTKIRTKSRFLKAVFSTFNVLKVPAPAVEYSGGKFKFRAISF